MTASEIYHLLKSFIGYGNPSSNYWFIGMEENWDFTCVNDVSKIMTQYDLEYYSKAIQPMSPKSYTLCKFLERCKKSGTYENGIRKILEIVENKNINSEDLQNDFFSTNAYFLPQGEESDIKKVFSINDFESHLRSEEERRKNIYSLWKSTANSKRITFCLSIGYEGTFSKLFSVEFSSNWDNSKIKYEQMENGEYIILLAHPSSRKHFPEYLEELKLFLQKLS